ncbi:MAG: glycosyltransferase [bacterium]|nr:glycosyltransferase [bacterium]
MKPKLSVVIACVNGLPSIAECLTALRSQRSADKAEVVVACCCTDDTPDYIERHFPGVILLRFDERLSIPKLRALGVARASGDIITITEDHCMAPENWFEEIIKAHDSDYSAIGGAVENGSVSRIRDWAVYLCEYSDMMAPIPDGEVGGIAGNNASYKRAVFKKVDDEVASNSWEFFLHEEMRRSGVKFLSVPGIVVYHKKEFGFLYFLAQRFHYSRSFAGMRSARLSTAKRIFYVFASPLLPPLMMWRITRSILRKKRHYREFVLSLPLLAAFMMSYGIGEFAGYLAGGGNSLAKVE